MAQSTDPCTHLEEVRRRTHGVRPRSPGCEECLQLGSEWVQLRLCLACGHVGCCDSSRHRHASAHFHATGHPVIRPYEPDAQWAYCYLDEAYLNQLPVLEPEQPLTHLESPAAD